MRARAYTGPLETLPPLAYDLIAADPAWSFKLWSEKGEAKSPQAHYDCLDLAAIQALPVGGLARGDCLLLLWATWPLILEAGATMKAWGFRYITGLPWVKTTVNGKKAMGPGYVVRTMTEPLLIGAIGSPKTRAVKGLIETVEDLGPQLNLDELVAAEANGVLQGQRREHSRKPEDFFELCDWIMPAAVRRLEMFSRQPRPGWDAWGNELGKFDADDEVAA